MSEINEILKLAQDLIRIESTKDKPNNILRCMDYAADYLKETGLVIKRYESNGIPNLVATKNGIKTPKIFLNGHMDVIEAENQQFEPVIHGDKLIGRGASDMKGSVAVMLYIMKELSRTNHDLGLMLVGDEESGGFNGTKYLMDQGYSCKAAVVPDGGTAIENIINKAKGAMWVEFNAVGKPAHSSRPWQGENAINKLMLAIDRVQNLFLDPISHNEDHWVATCSIGNIKGGDSANAIPGIATAVCDIRHTENENPEDLLKQIQNSLPDGVTAEKKVTVEILYTKEEDPYLKEYKSAIRAISREPKLSNDHGASDARFFSAKQIPALVSAPDGGGNHSQNEWVSIKALEDFYKMLRIFLNKTAQ